MSTAALKRQIDRLATVVEQIKPRQIVHYRLIGVPGDDATDEERAVYQAELAAAQAAGESVIRLVGIKPDPIKPDAPIQPDPPKRRWQKPADRQAQP